MAHPGMEYEPQPPCLYVMTYSFGSFETLLLGLQDRWSGKAVAVRPGTSECGRFLSLLSKSSAESREDLDVTVLAFAQWLSVQCSDGNQVDIVEGFVKDFCGETKFYSNMGVTTAKSRFSTISL